MVSDVLRNKIAEAGFRTAAKEIYSVENERNALRQWDEYMKTGQFYDPAEQKWFYAPMQLKPRRIP